MNRAPERALNMIMKKTTKSVRSMQPLTNQECEQLISAATDDLKGVLLTALSTGQRMGDIVRVRRGDVDSKTKTIRFKTHKTCANLETPINPQLREWLEPRLKSSGNSDDLLFPQFAKRGPVKVAADLRKLGKKLGIAVSSGALRLTIIYRLMERGMPDTQIRRILGYRPKWG